MGLATMAQEPDLGFGASVLEPVALLDAAPVVVAVVSELEPAVVAPAVMERVLAAAPVAERLFSTGQVNGGLCV